MHEARNTPAAKRIATFLPYDDDECTQHNKHTHLRNSQARVETSQHKADYFALVYTASMRMEKGFARYSTRAVH